MRNVITALILFVSFSATNASAATVANLGGAQLVNGVWEVSVGTLGTLFINYGSSTGARSTFNGVGAAGIPTPHFGLDAGDSFAITADFAFPALRLTVWDLDTVGGQETLTISSATDGSIFLEGAADNTPNGVSDEQSVLVATIMGETITLQAGPNGAAFAIGEIAAVPLPAAAWLFGSALLGFSALKRRRAIQA